MSDTDTPVLEQEPLTKAPVREHVNTAMRDIYVPGEGDPFNQPTRPGSERAFTIPSRGLR